MLKKLLVGGDIAGVLTIFYKVLLVLLVVVVMVGLLACTSTPSGVIIGSSLTLGPGQSQATISATDAEAIALNANPGTSVVENDLEKENGVLVYSIELSNGKDVAVDANTGEILQTAADDQDNQNESEDQDSAENESGADVEKQNEVDEQQPQYAGSIQIDENQNQDMSEAEEEAALQSKATISAADAELAALDANPGTTVVKTELDNENGVLVYSVELSNGNDVKVDAGTAKILHTETGELDGEGKSGE